MKNHFKNYLSSLLLFLALIMISSSFNYFLTRYQVNLTATAFNPVDLSSDTYKVASGFAWNDSVGWLNFGTSTNRVAGRVYVSNTDLRGYAWGENIGWVSLNCLNDGSCGNSSYAVANNDGTGELSGYAWGENIGWIDFAPAGGGVTIDRTSGAFSGYAWGENIGWISFSGTSPDYGVTTGWNNPPGGISPQACTYTYTDWSACINGNRSRTVLSQNYTSCSNQGVLNESCTATTTPIVVSISPTTLTAFINSTSTFSATVTGTTTTSKTWSILEGQAGGTISTSGLYTATGTPGTYHIVAKSTASTTASASATVTVVSTPIVNVSPASSTIFVGEQKQLSATVTGVENKSVDWILTPIDESNFYGTLTNDGLYTAPKQAVNVTIIARSIADANQSDTANIIVKLRPATTTPTVVDATSTASLSKSDLQPGEAFTINIEGWKANNEVEVTLHSTIVVLGKITTDSNGNARGSFNIPANTEPGTHAIQVEGTDSDNLNRIVTLNINILPLDNNDDNDDVTTGTVNTNTNNGSENGSSSNNSAVEKITKALDVSTFVANNITILGTTTEKVLLQAKKIIESKPGDVAVKTFTTAGVVGGGIAASSVFILNPAVAADLLFMPFRLWGLLLSALGLKKRRRPWGTVYDSVTKQPIDPAYVTLTNLESKKDDTSITDLDGRYGFLVPTGKYTLAANKTNYTFPSKKLAGKKSDELYGDLYFGEEINVQSGAVISRNIPLDPVNFDWNEFVKGKKKLMKFYSRREKITRIITNWIFRIGFVISLISLILVAAPYNLIIFGLYIILSILRKFGLRQKAFGSLTDSNNNPLSFAIIRIISPDLNIEITSKVADKIGRYYCLVPKGKYYVKIEKKNDDESYSLVHTSPVFEAADGIINKSFVS